MKKQRKKVHRPPTRRHHAHPSPSEAGGALRLDLLLKSSLITVGIGVALLVITALYAYFYDDPLTLIPPLGYLAAALTAFLGGVIAVRLQGHAAILCGLLNGVLVSGCMILASLFFRSGASGYSALVSATLHVSFLCLSVVGAVMGQKRYKPTKRRR